MPWIAQAVDWVLTAPLPPSGKPPPGRWRLAQVGEAAVDRLGVGRERLHHGAGAVGGAGRAGHVAPAAVVVLDLAQPGERLLEAAGGAGGAQGDRRRRRSSWASLRRSRCRGAWPSSAETRLRPPKSRGSTPAPSRARIVRARSPGLFSSPTSPRRKSTGVLAAPGDVERVAAGGLQAQHRPAGHRRRRSRRRARRRSRRRRSGPRPASRRRG